MYFFAAKEAGEIINGCLGDIRERFLGEKGLVRGDYYVRHKKKAGKCFVGRDMPRKILEKYFRFLLVYVKAGCAYLAGADTVEQGV